MDLFIFLLLLSTMIFLSALDMSSICKLQSNPIIIKENLVESVPKGPVHTNAENRLPMPNAWNCIGKFCGALSFWWSITPNVAAIFIEKSLWVSKLVLFKNLARIVYAILQSRKSFYAVSLFQFERKGSVYGIWSDFDLSMFFEIHITVRSPSQSSCRFQDRVHLEN